MAVGIEHELAIITEAGEFCDFSNATPDTYAAILMELPGLAPGDQLYQDQLGLKDRRWYTEGFERYDAQGSYLWSDPKGLEIRTPPAEEIDEAVAILRSDDARLCEVLGRHGFSPVAVGYNPFRTVYRPQPPLNPWELNWRSASPEDTSAYMHMLTYGADVSVSIPGWDPLRVVDAAKKLTYYSPLLVPYSFSSPFRGGELWRGLSRRTYYRTGKRPAALAHVAHASHLVASKPSISKVAHLASEAGRIEYKAFDAIGNIELYGSLLALIKGVILDTTLPGRALVPNAARHQHSALYGMHDAKVRADMATVLDRAEQALPEADRSWLQPLRQMLATQLTVADRLIERYNESGRITADILRSTYGRDNL